MQGQREREAMKTQRQPCKLFLFLSSPFARRWPWPSSRLSGCRFPFMRPWRPASYRLVHAFVPLLPLHFTLHPRTLPPMLLPPSRSNTHIPYLP